MPELREAVEHLAAVAEALSGVDFAAEPDLGRGLVELERQADRVQAGWLRGLAAFDASGEARAEGAGSTQAWLRHRCRMHPRDASVQVRTARALPELPEAAASLGAGEISTRHAEVLAGVVTDLGPDTARAAEPALVEAARRVDPRQLRGLTQRLRDMLDPDGAQGDAERQHARRRLSVNETFGGAFHLVGLLDAEGGATVLAALMPLAQPTGPDDTRTAAQRRADALTELARRALDGAELPHLGGERPHVNVNLGLETLFGQRGAPPAELDWAGPVSAEIARRLACDATITRLVTNQDAAAGSDTASGQGDSGGDNGSRDARDDRPAHQHADDCSCSEAETGHDRSVPPDLPRADALQPREGHGAGAALASWWAGLPPVLRDAPSQVLDVGRATRTVPPTLRRALAVRDRGCRFTGCDRPPVWTDAHHIVHWADGGATSLDGLVLLCRTHHRTVHEGGWTIVGNSNGELRFEPPAAPAARPPPAA